jgi:hypothetical protein
MLITLATNLDILDVCAAYISLHFSIQDIKNLIFSLSIHCYAYVQITSNPTRMEEFYQQGYFFLTQDVAVKILMEQDFHPERLKEFLREV